MTLAADAPTTDGSESLATDTSGIVIPSQDRKPFQSTDPGPEPDGLGTSRTRRVMNDPSQAPKLVNEKPNRDGRLLKIVLDGKRPITEAGDPTTRGPGRVRRKAWTLESWKSSIRSLQYSCRPVEQARVLTDGRAVDKGSGP